MMKSKTVKQCATSKSTGWMLLGMRNLHRKGRNITESGLNLAGLLLVMIGLIPFTCPGQVLDPVPIELRSPNEAETGRFGWCVAGIPDITGDGLGDVVIRGECQGHLFDGANFEYLRTLVSPSGCFRGWSSSNQNLSGIPNANDGGKVVGGDAPFGESNGAYIFSGLTWDLPLSLASPDPDPMGGFGVAVSGMAYVTENGLGEVIVGAPSEDVDDIEDAGRAYIFNGVTGDYLILESPNPTLGGIFGWSVSSVPDVDAEGNAGVVVAARGEQRVYIFNTATGPPLTLSSPNEEESGNFGARVSGIPDVTGDGHGDVVVAAYFEEGKRGRAYLFDGANGELLHTLISPDPVPEDIFGWSVSGVPDLNGDGLGEIIVGSDRLDNAGRGYVYDGYTGDCIQTLISPNEQPGGYFGRSVSGVSDMNGDGLGEVIVGAHGEEPDGSPGNAGRAYIFLSQFEQSSPIVVHAKEPAGSLIYDRTIAGQIAVPGETDHYTINLDQGQTITIVVDPDDSLQEAEVQLSGSLGTPPLSWTALSPLPGQDAVLQTTAIDVADSYDLTVNGLGGNPTGDTLFTST